MTRREAIGGAAALLWTPAGASNEDDLLGALDLDRPELAAVRASVQAGDAPAALRAFAAHLRARTRPRWLVDPVSPSRDASREEIAIADRALAHTFDSVGIRHAFGDEIDWSFNPTTQPGSPDASDHEWTWQLNRHSAWASLARAYNATGDTRYGRELASQIRDWIRDSAVPEGRALQSPFSRWRTIESGIRMFSSWPEVYHRMVRHPDVFPDDVLLAMVNCMRRHAEYLDAFPTGGNWLCMEANGQFHVGVLFPEFRDAGKWRDNALSRLRREIDAQVYPDGAQIELTPGYHNVSLRNFVGTLKLAQLNEVTLPDGYQAGLERMYDMNMRAMSPDRDVPPLNDSWSVNVRQVLSEGLGLFPKRADWEWIATDGKQGKRPSQTSILFPYAGWAVMRSGWDSEARFLMMDCGPFGYGHQHEDKLSFVLHAFGRRLVFDAGSYAYDSSDTRRYVLSARGHNVIHVDGLEQNRRGGPRGGYVVKAPVDVTWHTDASLDYVAARYGTLPEENWGPAKLRHVVHTRRVLFVKPDYWIVCDTLEPTDQAEHLYESTLHLDAADVAVDQGTRVVTTKGDGPGLKVIPLAVNGLAVRIVAGQKEPTVQGWLPRRHGLTGADPRPCVYYSLRGAGRLHLLYVFAPAPSGKPFAVEAVREVRMAGADVVVDVVVRRGAPHRFRLTSAGTVKFRRGNGSDVELGSV